MNTLGHSKGDVAVAFGGDRLLRLPGPSPVPDRIVRAMAAPMIGHRSGPFRDMLREAANGLKALVGTTGDVHILAGSGTLAMESAVANLLEPGQNCVVATAGKFGERWVELVEAFGAKPRLVEAPYGQGVTPAEVGDAMEGLDGPIVFVTQNESSTGVFHDVEAIAREVRAREGILVVDSVSCMGGAPMRMDAWGVDVVVFGSQKCLMLPPGLSFAAVGPRARERATKTNAPRYYTDWHRYAEAFAGFETPYTPAISLVYGLVEALALLAEEGDERRLDRHRLMRDMVRAGLKAMGCSLFVADEQASPTVTAASYPGLDAETLRRKVREETGVVLSGGQGSLKGRLFRVGHMGAATPLDVVATLSAIEIGLVRLGMTPPVGTAGAAAMEVWRTWNS